MAKRFKTDIFYHLVLVTKYRKPAITAAHLSTIQDGLYTLESSDTFTIVEFNGECDHLHFLVSASPKIRPSDIAGRIKGNISYHTKVRFSAGYYLCTAGGAPLEVIKKYIENQNAPD